MNIKCVDFCGLVATLYHLKLILCAFYFKSHKSERKIHSKSKEENLHRYPECITQNNINQHKITYKFE